MASPLDGVELTPPRRGLVSRLPLIDWIYPGAAVTRAQVPLRAAEWAEANRRDLGSSGPLWVVLGDSTAQAIGASAWDRGYVGQVRERLDAIAAVPWRVLNVSRSGDRIADVVHNQLPVLTRLGEEPALVSCVVGANDLLRTPMRRMVDGIATIAAALPQRALLGTVPQGLAPRRARELNAVIVAQARRRGLRLADIWAVTGPPWQGRYAADGFHPNDVGYAAWAAALITALELVPSS